MIDQLCKAWDGDQWVLLSWSLVGAVCTPSRHMIMSGRSVWHIPNRGKQDRNPNASNPKLVPPGLQHSSLPAVFNRAGYQTMRTCKDGNSYDAANALYCESYCHEEGYKGNGKRMAILIVSWSTSNNGSKIGLMTRSLFLEFLSSTTHVMGRMSFLKNTAPSIAGIKVVAAVQ